MRFPFRASGASTLLSLSSAQSYRTCWLGICFVTGTIITIVSFAISFACRKDDSTSDSDYEPISSYPIDEIIVVLSALGIGLMLGSLIGFFYIQWSGCRSRRDVELGEQILDSWFYMRTCSSQLTRGFQKFQAISDECIAQLLRYSYQDFLRVSPTQRPTLTESMRLE